MKHIKKFKKPLALFLLSFLFNLATEKVMGQCKESDDFSKAITLSATPAAGVWFTDRYAPAGFASQVNFNGNKRLKETIAASDGLNSRPPAFQFPFYNTQGRSYELANGSQYMDINLYIPADWASTNRRMAGFWGVAYDVNGDVSGYPIIEFCSDGGNPRFRGWDDVNGWVNMGLPASFSYNSWVKLQIELLASGEFKFTVGNLQMTTTANAAYGSKRIGNVILQGHNTTDGVNYDIYWDNLFNSCYIPCGNNNEKVMICHNGSELCVASNAVASHLAHGDVMGTCVPSSISTPLQKISTKPIVPEMNMPRNTGSATPFTLCAGNNDFSNNVALAASQAPGVWYTDRYAPNGFIGGVNYLGNKRLKHSIAVADGLNNRPLGYQFPFYNTQGRKYDLANGTQYMEIYLYVPSSWSTTGRRMAGFWGTAFDVNGDVSGFPIIEFSSDGANPRFRGWNDVNGWVDMGLPAGFSYNSWIKLQIELQSSGEFLYRVGNLQLTTTTLSAYGSLQIGNVILQGHNTLEGVDYDIYWDDLFNSCYLPCGSKNDKVIVCHAGNEICVAPQAVAAHLAHGDNLGRCNNAAANIITEVSSGSKPIAPDADKSVSNQLVKQPAGEKLELLVSPNPSTSYFKLQVVTGSNAPVTLRILDALTGRVISTFSRLTNNSSITIGDDLRAGTYYAEILQGNSRKTVQLIKL